MRAAGQKHTGVLKNEPHAHGESHSLSNGTVPSSEASANNWLNLSPSRCVSILAGGPHSTCPLCFEDVGSADDEDAWRTHLIDSCTQNPRRL